MVSGTTLSRQPENITSVGVVRCAVRMRSGRGGCGKASKRSAATKSCVHIVPPFELIAFAELPAQQHNPAVSERGEIDQATIEILQLDTQAFQFRHFLSEVSEEGGVMRTIRHPAASLFCSFGSQLCITTVRPQASPRTLNSLQNFAHRWQKRICLFDGKELHTRIRNSVSDKLQFTSQCSSVMRIKSAAAPNCSASSSIVVSSTTRKLD